MALLIGKKDIRSVFEKAWTTSYVSGLMQYAERSLKKKFVQILKKQVYFTFIYARSGTLTFLGTRLK